MNQKVKNANSERVNNIVSIVISLLSQGFHEEGEISPRIVNETKNEVLKNCSKFLKGVIFSKKHSKIKNVRELNCWKRKKVWINF